MKKTLKILIVLIISLSVIVTLWGFAIKDYNNRNVKDVIISINYNGKDKLITENDIMNSVDDIVSNKTIAQIDPAQIELRCVNTHWVKTADVSMSLDGIISINIEQRNPLLRIWKNESESMYLDYQGFFPLKEGYPVRVINVNGSLPLNASVSFTRLKDSTALKEVLSSNIFYKLLNLSDYIYNDEFLNALIEQIYVNTDGSVIMEPKIFNHSIYYGNIEEQHIKFSKLKALYLHLFAKNEINKYSVVNLSYKGQVVCQKKNNN